MLMVKGTIDEVMKTHVTPLLASAVVATEAIGIP